MMRIFHLISIVSLFLLSACVTLPENNSRTASYAMAQPTFMAAQKGSEFLPLAQGTDAFLARAVLAKKAQHTIDAQYYILSDDLTGDAFLALLIEAADRGVRVRVLLDDFLAKKKDKRLQAMEVHPNIEIRLFNPFGTGTPKYLQAVTAMNTITRRMHNKAFIVDNQAMVIGGRNIADEYFDADPKISYNDLDVLTWGPVVADVSKAFDAYWNNELAYPLETLQPKITENGSTKDARQTLLNLISDDNKTAYSQALADSNFARALKDNTMQTFKGPAYVIADDPKKLSASRKATELFLWDKVQEEFANTKKELFIISPYFVPGKDGTSGLIQMEEKGVEVSVLTNTGATNNHASVHANYIKYRRELIEGGVDIYELRPDFSRDNIINQSETDEVGKAATLHTKAFFIDRERSFIGSLNFDPRSFTENTEQGVIYDSPEMTGIIMDWLNNNMDDIAFKVGIDPLTNKLTWTTKVDSKIETLKKEPNQSLGRKFFIDFLKLIPIEGKV